MIKLIDLLNEATYEVYERGGSVVHVYTKYRTGPSSYVPFYATVDNRSDMTFKTRKELDTWLARGKYKKVGMDRDE
jgi:hypothetical protein